MSEQITRGKKIIQTSVIGIIANILLAVVKAVLGMLTGSLSLISDAMNNFSDSASSILTIAGTVLAGKKPDKKHPFGYGRVEYMTSFVVAVIVLITGAETFLSSFRAVFEPEEVNYTVVSVIVIAVTVLAKILLGSYTKSAGRKLDADSLVAAGTDAMGDALLSLLIIVSAVSSMYFHISIDAYAGMVIAVFIIKTGLEIVIEVLNKLLGEKADGEYAKKIIEEIEGVEGILGAHDMIVHNYGPAMNIGTINVELDAHTTVGEAYPVLHHLQMDILKKHRIYLVFGFYSVDEMSEDTGRLKETVSRYVSANVHCLGYHGLFVDNGTKEVYADIVLDYTAERKLIKEELSREIQKEFAEYTVIVTIDTEFV